MAANYFELSSIKYLRGFPKPWINYSPMDKRELEQSAFQEVTSSRGFVHECARSLPSREKFESRTTDAEVESVIF